ncbi:hypothetical protein L1987_26069 [Smallanthus sonchifolius]|uniref:Uncharacterized protein n=1 Tax=Smallanthus sonchifolius TaxID=185202 RepID=A0ACB9I9Y5_9ASTR|nr:hypothetical protein L1987_26069 [Smallanthus sonchifolius]
MDIGLICMGSQVLVLFRVSEDSPRHLRLVGDLGQPHSRTIEMMEKKVDTSLGMKFLELGDIPLMQEVVSVVRYPQGVNINVHIDVFSCF